MDSEQLAGIDSIMPFPQSCVIAAPILFMIGSQWAVDIIDMRFDQGIFEDRRHTVRKEGKAR
jgi:hypothetical protein